MQFSDWIAYFDESGDHGLARIDPDFPVFVLCGCLFEVEKYLKRDQPALSAIKFAHFGHDAVVFHSRDIRKRVGPFQILSNDETRRVFMDQTNQFFAGLSGVIVAAAIHKGRHVERYRYPQNPYSISLLFCLERMYAHLHDLGAAGGTMTCVFEQRGAAEDRELALEFARITGGENRWGPLPFRIVFAPKLANMNGLQAADLAAYPIARHVMAPNAANPAYDVLETRIRRSPSGQISGWGLKVFP